MTTELTKAAQQALEALKNVTDYDQINAARRALQSALTQRPAAQEVDDGDVTGQPGPLPETGWDEVPEGAFRKPSLTAGMNLGERIKHVGGRENAAGYIEFGSVAAVRALVRQYLRDLPTAQQATPEPDRDGEAFRTAARLGLTLRFYGGCAQSGMPGSPSAYEVVSAGGDPAAAMREAVERAAAVIQAGGEAQKIATPEPVGEPFGWLFQHEETGLVQVVDSQQIEWGFEANNPRWQKIRPVYTHSAPTQQAAGEPVGEPFKVEQCMQVASDEFDAFLIGGCKGEPPRMSMAFASTLFKTIIRERGMFFTATHTAPGVPEDVRTALEFYAGGNHFVRADADAWETVSGEPPNFWEDEANTATVEDGTIARNALAALAAAQAKGGEHG